MKETPEVLAPSELIKPKLGTTESAFILVAEHEHELKKEPFGSGFFIAPNLALTARHVIAEMWREYNYNPKLPFKDRELETNFKVSAYKYLAGENEPAIWYAEMVWNSEFTDISFLSLKPVNKLAHDYRMTVQPELTMDMPQKEEQTTAYGFPKITEEQLQGAIEIGSHKLYPVKLEAHVIAVNEQRKDSGMVKWPCIEVNAKFAHGMSGGPVYNEQGQICGVVCHENTASALWLAFLTPVNFENEIISFPEQYFPFELFEKGYILQKGWDKYFARYQVDFELNEDAWNETWRIDWNESEEGESNE